MFLLDFLYPDQSKAKHKTHDTPPRLLSRSTSENLQQTRDALGSQDDLVIHDFFVDGKPISAVLYLTSLADTPALGVQVIQPINSCIQSRKSSINLDELRSLLSSSHAEEFNAIGSINEEILAGNAVVLLDGSKRALGIFVRKRGAGLPAGQDMPLCCRRM